VNSDVNASAAIAYSKLNLNNSIVNSDVNASAAIAYSKLNLSNSIVNADVNASAAIAYSKLNLSGSIVNADVNSSAAIAYSKLNLANSIVSSDIVNGTITSSDLSSTGGSEAVATGNIQASAITTAKIADDQVTAAKLAPGAVEFPLGGGGTPANNATNFLALFGSGQSATQGVMEATLPSAGTFGDFEVRTSATPAGGDTWVFTVLINGATTTPLIECTVNNASTNNRCTDADSITVNAGDTIVVRSVPSGGPAASTVHWVAGLSNP
jgi:hypothetical protein